MAGLAVAGLAVVKVVVFDLSSLDALYRVGSVFLLALVALSLAYLYYRHDRREQTWTPILRRVAGAGGARPGADVPADALRLDFGRLDAARLPAASSDSATALEDGARRPWCWRWSRSSASNTGAASPLPSWPAWPSRSRRGSTGPTSSARPTGVPRSSRAKVDFLTVPDLGRLLRSRRISAVELTGAASTGWSVWAGLPRGGAGAARVRAGRGARAGCGACAGQGPRAAPRDPVRCQGSARRRGRTDRLGSPGYRSQLPQGDATVVRRLRRAGAVLCAKLAMVELAGGMGYRQAERGLLRARADTVGSVRWSGGSSSGPGAAVAAGLVPFAIGSETWGSIQYPAAFCGVTGSAPPTAG